MEEWVGEQENIRVHLLRFLTFQLARKQEAPGRVSERAQAENQFVRSGGVVMAGVVVLQAIDRP